MKEETSSDGKVHTLTVCALLRGDRLDLADRCLSSLLPHFQQALPCVNLRIGLDAVGRETRDYIEELQYSGINYEVFEQSSRIGKYAMMRRMFHDKPLESSHVMWFDDTACCAELATNMMSAALRVLGDNALLGQRWSAKLWPEQLAWAKTQPWFTGKTAFPGMPLAFPVGAWWLAKTELLHQFNWPAADMQFAGDAMLGLLLYQQGIPWLAYSNGVRINEDSATDMPATSSVRRVTKRMASTP